MSPRRLARICPRAFLALTLCVTAFGAPGKIHIELREPASAQAGATAWPGETKITATFTEEAFGFFELPQKYVSTGVRADRAFPTLLRATAEVRLLAGKHRLLLRSRGTARLFLDGKKILETPFAQPAAFAVGNAGELPVERQRLIAREVINNAPKHGRATHVTVEVGTGAHPLTMRIVDNGCGFDTASALESKRGHFGCAGMRERGRKIGATITWHSTLQKGATVAVVVPLRPADVAVVHPVPPPAG